MKTRSVLVRFPGYPLAMEYLLPDAALASCAAALLELGHQTWIDDWGTLEGLDRLFPTEGRDALRPMADLLNQEGPLPPLGALLAYWQSRQMDRAFRTRLEEVCGEVARGLSAIQGLDFVVLKADTADDAVALHWIADRLRGLNPAIRIFAAGVFVNSFAEALLDAVPAVDACCVGDVERSLVRLAEWLRRRDEWPHIANLTLRGPDGAYRTAVRVEHNLDELPAPAYEPEIYPALATDEKLRLFTIEDSRGRSYETHSTPPWQVPLRMKSAAAVGNEVWRLGTLYGARAFHFSGSGSPRRHVLEVAQGLLARGLAVVYSRAGRLDGVRGLDFSTLEASGCRAVEFRVNSGSQRLLEDFYGDRHGVSETEEVLRACKAAGIFTAARFVYPCPADDHHTAAETLRLAARTRPDAIRLELPEVLPGSRWYAEPSVFGFHLDRCRYFDRILKGRTRFPLPTHRWTPLPYRMGRMPGGEVIRRQEDILLALRSSCALLYYSEATALWARMLGYSGRERDFHAQSKRYLLEGDLAGIGELVGEFNRLASAPTRAVGLRPFTPFRAAVGN